MALGAPGTVLVLRALGLGDLLTGVPALRGLRRAFPRARLVLAAPAEHGAWLASMGIVDDALGQSALQPLTSAPRSPDLAVNLHGRGPQSHRLLAALEPTRMVAYSCAEAGFTQGPSWPEHVHEVDRWCRLVRWTGGHCGPADLRLPATGAAAQGRRYAVVHPGAAAPARRWPAERWGAVARALRSQGREVVLTGGPTESSLCAAVAAAAPGVVDLCASLDLPGLARTVEAAALVVCGDTGPAHLATAYGVPSVTLFGPTDPARWGPLVDQEIHRVLWHPMPHLGPGDPHGEVTDPRLAAVTVEEVLAAVAALRLDAPAVRPS